MKQNTPSSSEVREELSEKSEEYLDHYKEKVYICVQVQSPLKEGVKKIGFPLYCFLEHEWFLDIKKEYIYIACCSSI